MTELDLLDGLACEVKDALDGFQLRTAKDNLTPINVYTQNLPLKEGKNDEKLYPCVLICFDEEEIDDEDSPMRVFVYFVIGVMDKETDRQGFRDVLQIANLIYQHIFRKGIVARAFSPLRPYRIKLQEDDTYPYYYGAMEMIFEMPVFEMEDVLI